MITDLNALLQKVEQAQQAFGLASVVAQLKACRTLLAQGDMIEVAVFGRYKSGKSSFLNALSRTSVLPVGVLPVTAILTRMRHDPKATGHVEFADKRIVSTGLGNIADYVAEEKNPRNERRVLNVHIDLPSLEPYAGLEFIDTPGIGSVFKHNTEVSLSWLPYAAIALVLTSVDQPLSEEDLDFIRQLRRHTPRVALILTKADRINDSDLDRVLAFSRNHLAKEFKMDIPIFAFSSLSPESDRRIAQWRKVLDEELLKPLRDNRAQEQGRILSHKCRSLLNDCIGLLDLALKAAMRSAEEREQIKQYVFEEGQSLPLIQKEIRLFTYDLTSKMTERLWEHTARFQRDLRRKLLADFHRQWPGWRANLWGLTRMFEQWLKDILRREMQELSERERHNLLAPLKETEAGLKRIVEGFLARLAERISQALGVAMSPREHSLSITEPESPDVSVGTVFDTQWDSLWFIIPMILFRPLVRRHFAREINWEAEKHLARTAAQWAERINRAIKKAAGEEEAYVKEQIDTFQTMLSATDQRIPAIRQTLDELHSLPNTVKERTS